MSILTAGGLTKYYGAELIFAGLAFQVARGDKIALVGVNGAGKSTLLKILAGVESPSEGGAHLARGTRVAYLAQEVRFEGQRTLWQELETSLEHLSSLQRELAALEHDLADTGAPEWEQRMERYGELAHRFEHAGGYEIEHRIERTLYGLGFTPEQFHQPLAQFSGGQRTRAALAAALLSDPDLLLLDEPTNHLDLAALEWLERFLKEWDGTLIVISHDRYFLDTVTNRTLELGFGRIEDYPAPYQRYLALKAERLESQLKQYQAQQEYIAKTEEFIRRFKSGQRSKEAHGRLVRLERLKAGEDQHIALIDRPQQQRQVAFAIKTGLRAGEVALRLANLVVGYAPTEDAAQPAPEARTLIRCPDLEIRRGQRVALMGPNGSGKTTLLRTIVGELPPLRGNVRVGHNVAINYYAQAHEGLRMQATLMDEIRRVDPLIEETRARTLLGRFLFSGDDVFKRVGDLSGGERSRLALAQLTLMAGNLLVLDEPTNHLDINAREALEEVLNDYNGTILFVSHDRYFIDAVADTIWMVQGDTIAAFHGTYTEYIQATREQGAGSREQGSGDGGQRRERKERTEAGGQGAESSNKKALHPSSLIPHPSKEDRKRQRKLASLEQEIAMLEAELKQIEADMIAASAARDVPRVTSLGLQHTEVSAMLESRYDEWGRLAG